MSTLLKWAGAYCVVMVSFVSLWAYFRGKQKGWWQSVPDMVHELRTRKDFPSDD